MTQALRDLAEAMRLRHAPSPAKIQNYCRLRAVLSSPLTPLVVLLMVDWLARPVKMQ
jgi:hypothetical protein